MDVCRDTPHADTHEMILRAGDTNTATSTPVRRERPSDDCGGGADHRAAGPGRAHRAHRPGASGLPRAPVPPVLMSAEEKRKASRNLRKAPEKKERKKDKETDEAHEQRRLAKSVENAERHDKSRQRAVGG